MITIEQKANQIDVAVLGEFTLADFKEFEALELLVASAEAPVNLFLDLRQMAKATLDVVWEEVKFLRAHGGDFQRIAVVTDSQWATWSTWLARAYAGADLCVFADAEDAQYWLANGATSNTLVSVVALQANLENWRVIDCRYDLTNADAGLRAYADGHIPGALYLHIDQDLSGQKTGYNGRHPLPDIKALAQRLGECGIDSTTQVVAYDSSGGMFAARLWWLLRWLGHERVAVLDGGVDAWQRAGLEITREVPNIRASIFEPKQCPGLVDAATVKSFLHTSEAFLLDARSPDRYRGENETLDPVGGHIPGAHNRFFRNNLDEFGNFKTAEALRAEFTKLLGNTPAGKVVHSCGSGISACHNVLAMEVAGLSGSRFYSGSWSEWCSDPARPVETGEAR